MTFATVTLDTGSNFPADSSANQGSIINSDLTLQSDPTINQALVSAVSTVFQTTGTFFFEVRVALAASTFIGGIRSSPGGNPTSANRKPYSFGIDGNFSVVVGDYVEYAVSLDEGKMWVGKNGVWQSGDPSLDTSPSVTWTPGGDWYAYGLVQGPGGFPPASAAQLIFNFGDSPFFGQMPASWSTLNHHNAGAAAQTLQRPSQALAGIADVPNPFYYSWFKDRA